MAKTSGKLACGILLSATVLVACAAETEYVIEDEAPLRKDYTIQFQSVSSAIATDTIRVQVFPVTNQDTCLDLIRKRTTKQALPTPTAESPEMDVCAVAGKSAPAGSDLKLAFGEHAFLAVGRRAGADYLIGCTTHTLQREGDPAVIRMTFFESDVSIPPTTCPNLATFCANKKCP